jgi:hypothetical protein
MQIGGGYKAHRCEGVVGIEMRIDRETVFRIVDIERTQRRKVGLGAREVDI